MKRLAINIVFLTLLFPAAAQVQAQMEAPKPGPELKKLNYFLGDWTLQADMKPGPMGPGGKMTMTEHVEWMEGNFFLVLNSDFKGASGNGTAIAFMGYNPDEKVYSYDEFNSVGEAEHSKGSVGGDTWTWTSDEKMGGQVMKGRFTMKTLSPASYSFKFESSPDGSKWTTFMDGTATKGS